jgi:hypothetical protein
LVEAQFQKRQTACKIRIKDILDSKYLKTEGMDPNYLDIGQKQVSRVNILGVIVENSGASNYKSIIVDDGSGKVSARIFDDKIPLENFRIGDVVTLIGRPREFSSEKYIIIETIKKVDPSWAKVRNLELHRSNNMPLNPNPLFDEEKGDLTPRNKVLKMIKELDTGGGVYIESILSKNIKDAEKIIDSLMKEGSIFEPKPGKLRVLE